MTKYKLIAPRKACICLFCCSRKMIVNNNQRRQIREEMEHMYKQKPQGQDRNKHKEDNKYVTLQSRQMLKLLECPVCLEVAWPPKKIFQCMQGHIICNGCRKHLKVTKCPICRQQLKASNTARNLALENLALGITSDKLHNSNAALNLVHVASTSKQHSQSEIAAEKNVLVNPDETGSEPDLPDITVNIKDNSDHTINMNV